ncbi:calcium-binding protein [Testudinibacter sp. TR-2022]|uniref:calcium-binding protein n=1 Tax=Testudinibacter sp. TR-2022 TaxID=2585029 RepID=UPI001119F8A2|nr:Mbeg1-like protein [Testudinibacter sp. TR-2022]TNH20652.1 DUF2974 domain-containing protein [Testudinibacter sp. TR-2022]TNH27946.1 DUF2974 domain-containing protein [Testudinibacter sp. TR-2022]
MATILTSSTSSAISTLEYAILAANSNVIARHDNNRFILPPEWQSLDKTLSSNVPLTGNLGYVQNTASGFEAKAYMKGEQIVIAFAGTNVGDLKEWVADFQIALAGKAHQQIFDAAIYYKEIVSNYPDKTVSFTGHSLGGGLAALAGVFFDKPAITFDPAPFRLAATEAMAKNIATVLRQLGYEEDQDLNAYHTVEKPIADVSELLGQLFSAVVLNTATFPTKIRGEENILAYALRGEFLTDGIPFLTQGLAALKIAGEFNIVKADQAELTLSTFTYHGLELLVLPMIAPKISLLSRHFTEIFANLENYEPSHYSKDKTATLIRFIQQEVSHLMEGKNYSFLNAFADDIELVVNSVNNLEHNYMLSHPKLRSALLNLVIDYYYHIPLGEQVGSFFEIRHDALYFSTADTARKALINEFINELAMLNFIEKGTLLADLRAGNNDDWIIHNHIERGMFFSEMDVVTNNIIIGGNHDDNIKAGSGDDIIFAGQGHDVINGGAGADKMYGGAGNDVYYVDNHGDHIIEGIAQGDDLVNSNVTYTLGQHLERLTLIGDKSIAGYGNILNNTLHGNVGNNILDGGWGNDQLYGGAGNDILIGGQGNDRLDGGEGKDILQGGIGNDTYIFGTNFGRDVIKDYDFFAGRDVLRFTDAKIEQSYFFREKNDLIVALRGTSDSIKVENWFKPIMGYAYQVEVFEFTDVSVSNQTVSQIAGKNYLPLPEYYEQSVNLIA